MKNAELRSKEITALNKEVEDLQKARFSARLQLATQQSTDSSQLSKIRKNIARVKTIISEKARKS